MAKAKKTAKPKAKRVAKPRVKCAAKTKSGRPCRNYAVGRSKYCKLDQHRGGRRRPKPPVGRPSLKGRA